MSVLNCSPVPDHAATTFEVYAISFANMGDRPLSAFVSEGDSTETTQVHCMMWLLKGSNGRSVLVDAGFQPDVPSATGSATKEYIRPDQAMLSFGIRPEEIDDIIITHMHWDHVDGVDLFPNAEVWVQKAEFEYYVGDAWQTGGTHRGIESRDVLKLVRLNTEGRLTLVDGDDQPIMDGITVYTGPRHTYASQYVGVSSAEGTVVIASDNVPTYANLETGSPPTTTFDPNADLRAYDRMKQIASSPDLIIPGHDGAVLTKYPKIAEGVVRVAPSPILETPTGLSSVP
ncbi:MAG: N-acyl homoserine lactonase family protein [Gemmatimonadota bacterium]|nr:MAG: N-acyl homoserine lactonase family protein [Gemmatimonadota bacterium]